MVIIPVNTEVYLIAKNVWFVQTEKLIRLLELIHQIFLVFLRWIKLFIIALTTLVNAYMSAIMPPIFTHFLNIHNKVDIISIMHNLSLLMYPIKSLHLKRDLEPIFIQLYFPLQTEFSIYHVVWHYRISIPKQNHQLSDCIPHYKKIQD